MNLKTFNRLLAIFLTIAGLFFLGYGSAIILEAKLSAIVIDSAERSSGLKIMGMSLFMLAMSAMPWVSSMKAGKEQAKAN